MEDTESPLSSRSASPSSRRDGSGSLPEQSGPAAAQDSFEDSRQNRPPVPPGEPTQDEIQAASKHPDPDEEVPPLSEYSERELRSAISRAADYLGKEKKLSQIHQAFDQHCLAADFSPTAGLQFVLSVAAITEGSDERVTDEKIRAYLPAEAHLSIFNTDGILARVPFSVGSPPTVAVKERSTGRVGPNGRRLSSDAQYHISDEATSALRRLASREAYRESVGGLNVKPVNCGCGQCEAWKRVVEEARNQRVFTVAQYLELAGVMMDLLHEGPRQLRVDQYLDRVSDEIEALIRERTDGEAGEWFDIATWLAEREPVTFGTDTYRPGLLLKNFDERPDPASCKTLAALLSEQASAEAPGPASPPEANSPDADSLFARLRAVSAGSPDRSRSGRPAGQPGTEGDGGPATGTAGAAATGAAGTDATTEAEEGTANAAAKDSENGHGNGEKRDLQRSDRESGAFAVGRNSAPDEVTEPDGIHFSSRWTITRRQAQMIAQATQGLTDASHHFFVHAARSSRRECTKSGGWFPFHYKHICQALPVTEEEYDKTERVWRPIVERGLIEYEKHSHPDGDAREFCVTPDWLLRFSEAALVESGSGKASIAGGPEADDPSGTVDAFTGEVTHRQKAETRLHDPNNKPFRNSLRAGLKVLKTSKKRFNKRAVEDWLVHRKRKVVASKKEVGHTETEAFREHKQAFFNVHDRHLAQHGWPTGITFERWKMICPEQKYTTEHLRFRKLRKSYINDLRCYAAVMRQKPERVDGEIWEYDTAWRAQLISGRVSEVGGALQSCSRPMKAAAYDGVGVYNYDLKGSQLRDVIEASEMVPNIDTDQLRSMYIETSKTENAKRLGISRDTYKRLLYATTFLGNWKKDFWTAINSAKTSRGLPETVGIVKRAAWEEGIDPNEVYRRASEHFQALTKAVRELADYLLRGYWEANRYNAGGYVMRNDCGVAFRKGDYETGTDEDGNPTYNTHEIRSKVLAWYLQGSEADKMHRLAVACREAGIQVLGHEHDGLITASPISTEIQDEVLPHSELERKDFQDFAVDTGEVTKVDPRDLHAELCEVLGAHDGRHCG